MELREFAEQIVFGTDLEGKLRWPGEVTDEHPGAPLPAPVAPGRPAGLKFKPSGSARGDVPSLEHLERDRERGRLLHCFANHELLATELMGLVLLRFPDAPAEFRQGVLRTLRDEQIHTRLYLKRLSECGMEFGELPVSGYFWRAIAPMEQPMDFVSGLSLTFEQANLDFCRHFARGFERVGDSATARLLEKIYRDEIGHVAHGLNWFRRWKPAGLSDWDAYCGQLRFPLSPRRAKGVGWNPEGRRSAGLEEDFIARLEVYSQSKGRTPGVYLFNPFSEGYVARGKSFTPVKHQALLAGDLANLPQYLCRQDDIVLVPRRPSVGFLAGLQRAGMPLPEFVELDGGRIPAGSGLRERKLGGMRPWAWGPDSEEVLSPLLGNVTGASAGDAGALTAGMAALYSKAWSAGFLRRLLSGRGRERWLCTEDEVGVVRNTVSGVMEAVETIRRRGHWRVVVKEALGLAGRNAIRLWEDEVSGAQKRWIERAVEGGREVVIEPWLEREMDFSVQLEMGSGRLVLCGYTGLINDRKGQYLGNWVGPDHSRRPPHGLFELLGGGAGVHHGVPELFGELFARLEAELRRVPCIGPVGLDAFVYRMPDGGCRLKPVVELNPRYTMGRVAVELMKRVCPGRFGLLRLHSRAQVRALGWADFKSFAADMAVRHPVLMKGEPEPRIHEGILCLTDPESAAACLATWTVSGSAGCLEAIHGMGKGGF